MGRPKYAEIAKAARALLALKIPGDPQGRTWAEAAVEAQATKAVEARDTNAFTALADRAEGRPRQSMEIESTTDPLLALIASMDKRSDEIGDPEEDCDPVETAETER